MFFSFFSIKNIMHERIADMIKLNVTYSRNYWKKQDTAQ